MSIIRPESRSLSIRAKLCSAQGGSRPGWTFLLCLQIKRKIVAKMSHGDQPDYFPPVCVASEQGFTVF